MLEGFDLAKLAWLWKGTKPPISEGWFNSS